MDAGYIVKRKTFDGEMDVNGMTRGMMKTWKSATQNVAEHCLSTVTSLIRINVRNAVSP